MAGVPHPIPSRTRPLSPPAPMVLRLKTWESRSLPGPQRRMVHAKSAGHTNPSINTTSPSGVTKSASTPVLAVFLSLNQETKHSDAGWSSPVARQAHNLKVVGSNPTPAPKHRRPRRKTGAFLLPYAEAAKVKYQAWPVSCFHCATSLRACFS